MAGVLLSVIVYSIRRNSKTATERNSILIFQRPVWKLYDNCSKRSRNNILRIGNEMFKQLLLYYKIDESDRRDNRKTSTSAHI